MTEKPVIAVWFSCGAASAIAAQKTLELYGQRNTVRILNNPVKEEDEDNQRFLRDVQQWLNHPIETVVSKKFPSCSAVEVWDRSKFMASRFGAPCTVELKKKARQEWESTNRVDWHVLGFTYEEKKRHDRFVLTERSNLLPVLIDLKITKQRCFQLIANAGITLPRMYQLGYPNANCIGCVKAGSATYWNHVRKTHPDVFEHRAEQSRRLGAKLVRYKGKQISLDELDSNAIGKPMRTINFECGLFCEEDTK